MYMHQQYNGIIIKQNYVPRESKLSCSFGSNYSLLDIGQDHGIYKGNLPLMTTIDSGKNNIYHFGSCLCPESNYAGRLPMTAETHQDGKKAKKAINNKYAHICVPMVPEGSAWKQVDHSIMAKSCAKGFVPVLVDNAVIVCQYGGLITVVEVPQTGTNKSLGNGDRYFVISSTNLTVREDHSTSSNEVTKFSPGERFKIVTPKSTHNDGVRTWIKVNLEGNKTGWVVESFVLPDEPIVTLFPESIYEKVTGNFSGTVKTENYIKKWGAPGKGTYTGSNQKSNGRYKVAVAPKILNPRYSDDGKVWLDELKAFNKNITIVLENISTGTSKELDCVVTDLKAHSYNKYPDGHGYTLGGTGNVNVENGLIQTGIAYPNSMNAGKDLACSIDHMNGTIVEFCSNAITDFRCEDYKILKIISNK